MSLLAFLLFLPVIEAAVAVVQPISPSGLLFITLCQDASRGGGGAQALTRRLSRPNRWTGSITTTESETEGGRGRAGEGVWRVRLLSMWWRHLFHARWSVSYLETNEAEPPQTPHTGSSGLSPGIRHREMDLDLID